VTIDVDTRGSGGYQIRQDVWQLGQKTEFGVGDRAGTAKGRLFDFDPVTQPPADKLGTWFSAPGPTLGDELKVIAPVAIPLAIGLAGAALIGGAAAGTGAAAGSGAAAGGVASGGVAAGSTGFTLAGSIPAFTAAQNAAGLSLAASGSGLGTLTGAAGLGATTAVGVAGASSASSGIASLLGTAGKTVATAGDMLGSVVSGVGALRALNPSDAIGSGEYDVMVSPSNPLGLMGYNEPYPQVVELGAAPSIFAGELAGVPVWIWLALAGAAVYLGRKA